MSLLVINQKSPNQQLNQQKITLQNILENNNINLLQLLSIKSIQSKIRANFTYFIRYCQKNEQFSYNLIDIGIKCPMHQGSSQNMKNICYIAADILTCDQDIVADLFILPDKNKKKKKHSDDQSDQFQEIEENIESEAQNTANQQQSESFQVFQSKQQHFKKKYKFLIKLLQYIQLNQIKDLNQNCINYMIKAMNCLVRKKGDQFIYFLQQRPNTLKRMIQLNLFSSMNQFFIKILSDDEIDHESIKQIKKIIIEGVLQNMKSSIKSQQFIQRLDFLQQLFQTNKYTAEDDRTQLQKLSDLFVTQQVAQFVYRSYLNPTNQFQFYNAVSYFATMIKRMNVDEQLDPYSYSNEPRQQTMLFKMDILFKQFQKVVKKGYENIHNLKYSQNYRKKLSQTKYYQFLSILARNSRFTNCQSQSLKQKNSLILLGNNIILKNKQQKIHLVKQFLNQFINQGKKSGINKNYLISLIEKLLTFRIYSYQNHKKQDETQNQEKQKQKIKHQQKQEQASKDHPNPHDQKNNSEKKIELHEQIEQSQQSKQQKKKKINKIKAGLKLDIKRFSSQSLQKKQQDKKQQKSEDKITLAKLEQSLSRHEVMDIINYFLDHLIKNHLIDQNTKSKKTQLGAFINKIIIILLNSICWKSISTEQNAMILQKQKLIDQIEKLFPSFNSQYIISNYSITLATTKHPNNNQKSDSHPQLAFFTTYFDAFAPKNIKEQNYIDNKNGSNNILDDSLLKSEQEDQDSAQAVKCSLQDFIKFTGFKFEDKNEQKAQTQTPAHKQTQMKQQILSPETQLKQDISERTKEATVSIQPIVEEKQQSPKRSQNNLVQQSRSAQTKISKAKTDSKVENIENKSQQILKQINNKQQIKQKTQKSILKQQQKQDTKIVKTNQNKQSYYLRHKYLYA